MTRLHTNVISDIKIKYDFKRELCGRVTRTRLFSHIFPRLRFFKDQVFVFAEEMVSFQEPRMHYYVFSARGRLQTCCDSSEQFGYEALTIVVAQSLVGCSRVGAVDPKVRNC